MDGEPKIIEKLSHEHMYSWYFTREELVKFSLSRKDGITESKESEIRHLYCSFIWDVGIRLKLPQMTIATAIMFCHRFYLHQSLAKNGWQTVATVCVFLASKVEDTPCPLDLVVRVAYETMYRRDLATAQRIRQKDVFEKQKALILIGERLVLTTIRFDFNIQHPYRPLLDAMKNLGIIQKEVKQVAWNFVNDWLKTTLCLQYKPQYIAAGSLYLAAKLHNIKLPLHGAHVWWHQFDVAPKPLEAIIQQMMEHVAMKRLMSARPSLVKQKEALSEAKLLASNSPDSVLNQSSLSINSSSPDIGEPNDHIQVNSGQYSISSHTGDCRISGPDGSLLNVSANRNEESWDQALITNHGVMSCSNQTSLDVAATEGNAGCVKHDVSNCKDSNNTVSGQNLNQASINRHGDGVNPFSVVISLDADVDREGTQCVEPSVANSNPCTESLNADSLCSDRSLADPAAGTINDAPSALPVGMEVDPLSAELKKVDVARIKNLLMKRKRRRDVQEQAIASDDITEEAWIERELEAGIVATKQEAHHAATSDELSDDAWIERELESGIVVGPRNEQVITLDGLSEDDWIERELESGIIVEPAPASKKQKLESSCR
ncbi:cyclin-T1-2-like [Phragmites australis]|uniref:cyclin-T1-2-like n=1 Tax=Phragmites australis TaxID=29695 RepID=UPI002D77F1C0|nr:cyclin-T1-2-like [Phragmites australis]XP_062223390.1 cyclin-T1-2-like [Phragmites australis]